MYWISASGFCLVKVCIIWMNSFQSALLNSPKFIVSVDFLPPIFLKNSTYVESYLARSISFWIALLIPEVLESLSIKVANALLKLTSLYPPTEEIEGFGTCISNLPSWFIASCSISVASVNLTGPVEFLFQSTENGSGAYILLL